MDFGSDAIFSEKSDEHVGVSACSPLITGDGHHLINWRGFNDIMQTEVCLEVETHAEIFSARESVLEGAWGQNHGNLQQRIQ